MATTDDPRLIRVPDDEEAWETLVEVGSEVIAKGDLVVLPTDTVYGVGCDPFNPSAVDALFRAKGRGRDLPLPVLVQNWRQAIGLVEEVDDRARSVIAEFWPGPLTIVFRESPGIGWDLGNSRGTVAVRMPKQAFTLTLIRRTGPLAVTSANRSGRPTPDDVAGVMAELDEGVGVYFDAGPAQHAPASTILDLSGPRPRVLRQGAITAERIGEVIGAPVDDPRSA